MSDEDASSQVARLLTQASGRADGVVARLITLSESDMGERSCRLGDALSSMSEIVMGELDGAGLSLEIVGDLNLQVFLDAPNFLRS